MTSRFLIVTAGFSYCNICRKYSDFADQKSLNVYWQNRAQNGYLTSHQSSAKYEDATKSKYMTCLMDKAIAMVNQNELD